MASKKLEEAVKDAQLDPNLIKTSVDEKHKEMISNLSDAPADKFNKKYTDMQLDAHKEAVELLEDYSNNGDNQILKDFASKTLPTLQAHLSHVKELEAKIK